MGNAYEENERLCQEHDAAQRRRGRKKRHYIHCAGKLSERPKWVRTGHYGLVGHVGVRVIGVTKQADQGKHDAALLSVIPLTPDPEPPIIMAGNLG